MSVLRNLNILSQMRLDVPHIRLLESGVAGDFDVVVGRATAGSKPLVVKGFTINGTTGVSAATLQLAVADSIAFNVNASESGSFIWVPSDQPNEVLDGATNDKVIGSFAASSVNYIGLDWVRLPDASTADLVKFKDPATNEEEDRLVPLGKTLQYRIVISTIPFSSQLNVVPIAKVVTNGFNNVTSITDARNMMFRLGSGGDNPNQFSSYNWPQGRYETSFSGGDKAILSQKDWNNAIMTRIWELGGGQNWYSPSADRNVEYTNYGAPFTNGEYFTFNSGSGAVTWQGIRFFFDGGTGVSPPTFNEVEAGGGTILDGQVVFVDLDRTQNRVAGVNGLTASIANLANLGTGSMPGNRWVIAWRVGTLLYTRNWRYPVGTIFQPATTSSLGVVKLNQAPDNIFQPTVVSIMTGGRIEVSSAFNGATATFENTNSTTNSAGVRGTGKRGVVGIGTTVGGTAGIGLYGTGNGTGAGAEAYGGNEGGNGSTLNGVGVFGQGSDLSDGGTGAVGVWGEGTGVGPGVRGVGAQSGGGVGPGVVGVGATAGGAGVEGQGVDSAGVIGNGTGIAGPGVVGNSVLSNGVVGNGGSFSAGVYGVAGSGTSTPGVEGLGAVGVRGSAFGGSNGPGVLGLGNGTGAGVQGDGDATSTGMGVWGRSTGGSGVVGQALGASNHAFTALVTGTGRAFNASAGDIGVNPANRYEFTTAKTGKIFVSITELQAVQGSAVIQNTGAMNIPHYVITQSLGIRLMGTVRLPRGATITGIDAHVYNTDVSINANVNKPLIYSYVYNTAATAMTRTSVLSAGTFSVGPTGNLWFPLSSVTPTTVVNGTTNSGTAQIDWTLSTVPSPLGDLHVAGLMFTYTYEEVDFMV